jgi:nucleoside-diphosphate-sugar epimerase
MHKPIGSLPHHVLVTGAAGLLGRAVVGHLRGLGVGVTAMLHRPGDIEAERVVVGNMSDVEFVRDAVEGADAVVHCAALRAPMIRSTGQGTSAEAAITMRIDRVAGSNRVVSTRRYPPARGRRRPAGRPVE